jgi:hypothetical protein
MPSAKALRSEYSWIGGRSFSFAMVARRQAEDCLEAVLPSPAFGPESTERVRSWARDAPGLRSVVDANALQDWVIVCDSMPVLLSMSSVMQRLSQDTRVVTLIKTHDVTEFSYWLDGSLRRRTDPTLVTDLVAAAFFGEPLQEEDGLPFEKSPGLGLACTCVVIERLTEIQIQPDLLYQGDTAVGWEM